MNVTEFCNQHWQQKKIEEKKNLIPFRQTCLQTRCSLLCEKTSMQIFKEDHYTERILGIKTRSG